MNKFKLGQQVSLIWDEGKPGYSTTKVLAIVVEVHETCVRVQWEHKGQSGNILAQSDGRITNWGDNSRIETLEA